MLAGLNNRCGCKWPFIVLFWLKQVNVTYSNDLSVSNQLEDTLTHLDNICSPFYFCLKIKLYENKPPQPKTREMSVSKSVCNISNIALSCLLTYSNAYQCNS